MNDKLSSYLRQEELETAMIGHFRRRTREHIDRVKKNAAYLARYLGDAGPALLAQVAHHDDSKWEEPEYTPYLHVSWKHKMKAEGKEYNPPQHILDAMHEATAHHITHNRHHPEYWDDEFDPDANLNKDDRDGVPERMVSGEKMDLISVAEMVCDWTAMAQEMDGNNDATSWAKKVVNVRWKFTEDQVASIYRMIERFKESDLETS